MIAGGEALTWGALITSSGALIAIAVFWMNRGKAEAEAKAAAFNAQTVASTAIAKCELLSRELAEARVEFARDYVSNKDLAAAEIRFANAVDDLRGELRGLNRRLDRVLDRAGGVAADD